MPDAEHGGGTGIGSGMGSGHGSGNQGGGNPADANNPGVSTGIEGSSGAVDSSGASRGYEGSTPDLGFNLGSPTGSHPDEGQPGFGVSQSFDDVDYGYYDGFAPSLSTQQMAHSVFDPSPSLSTQQLGHPGATFSHNWDNPNTQFSPMESTPVDAWDNPNTQFSPMEFGPQHQMSLSTQQLGQNVTVGYVDPETTTLEAIAQQQHEQATTGVSPDSNPVGPTRSFQEQAMDAAYHSGQLGTPAETESTAPPTSVTGTAPVRDYRGTPSITTGPTVSPTVDPVQEAKTKQMRAISVVQGWRDLFDKSKKAWGPFKNFSPAYDQRTKTAIVKDLYEKYGPTLQEATKEYSKQVNKELDEEGVGFRGLLPGYSAIRGLMGLIGLEEEHTHPAHQALLDMMEDAGLIDKDYGEGQTEAAKRIACESKGYKWDSDLQACIKSGSDI